MARLLYALNGQGRGHASRSRTVAHTLRRRGHEVVFCCGGEAADRLRADGEPVVPVEAPREIVRGNRVRLLASAKQNLPLALRSLDVIEDLAARIDDLAPDLIVSDFEPFAPRAARRLGIPAVALCHQHILSETRCPVPLRFAASAALTRLGIAVMAPGDLFERIVVPSFFFPPVRRSRSPLLVPPIIRDEVLDARPTRGEHVVVYFNHPDGSDRTLRALADVDAPFRVYNVPQPANADQFPGLTFCPAGPGFLDDLASARAVVCTAGFTLLSEALHLGKPVLALPNRGFFEQAVNALALRDTGRGEAVFGKFRAEAVRRFLADPPRESSVADAEAPEHGVGNERAADHIEAALPRRTLALAS